MWQDLKCFLGFHDMELCRLAMFGEDGYQKVKRCRNPNCGIMEYDTPKCIKDNEYFVKCECPECRGEDDE